MSYFIVFEEFGFTPGILNRLVTKPYFHHNPGDIYDPAAPFAGNTNVQCVGGDLEMIDYKDKTELNSGNLKGAVLDWLFTTDIE